MNHQAKWNHASPGDPVWLSDPDEAYLEAKIVSIAGDNVTVETRSGRCFTVDCSIVHDRYAKPTARFNKKNEEASRRLLPRTIQRLSQGVENMDDLNPLNEASILSNIEHRFRLDHIYTRTGPILIAMNPFKWLPIYGEEIIRQYHNRPYGALPPHCFQEAEDAYQQLQFTKKNQSAIICGESGSGKTETTKLMLLYLSVVARDKVVATEGHEKTIGEKLVQSNPLMEAFGNAKTLRNNNSSRFGKFTLLNFDKGFRISGGRVSNFLLEKSRVVRQQKGERNYHIFYQLVAGASDQLRKRLELPAARNPESFFYLNQSDCLQVDGVDDAQDLTVTRNALSAVSIEEAEQDDVFQLVAGVLHLGNVEFLASEDGEQSTVKNPDVLHTAAKLLGLPDADLSEAVTTRVRQLPGNKTIRSPQTETQSLDSRDALAKSVYNKLFDFLVVKINEAFDRDRSQNPPFIGILDIFGFEDMAINGFEQLLINFTNERLQLLFNETTFKMEEQEYIREQIQWDRTDFPDNQPCVDLIEKKPMGLLPVLDSECSRGNVASDASLVATYNKAYKSHGNYGVCGPSTAWKKPDSRFTNENDFVIIHFAGPVIYTCEEFVDKNRDALFDHVATLLSNSTNPMIADMFTKDDATNALRAASVTVSNRFTGQLNNLMHTLESCNSRFVRCIKSNQLLHPQEMEKPSVLKQLVCSGVMAALEVRRAGFPTRIKYDEFVKEFRVFSVGFPRDYSTTQNLNHRRTVSQVRAANLDHAHEDSNRELTARMMTHPAVVDSITAKQYRLGVTKLFLQADALIVLQSIKNSMILPQVLRLQKWWIQQSQNVLAHKLTRAIATLADLQAKAEVSGVHRVRWVRNALDEAAAAVRYARGLGNVNTDVFRPALDTAWKKLEVLREVVKKAIEAKEREAQQRAELLSLLDSGRARLNKVSNGMSQITLDTTALKADVRRAFDGLEQRNAELLRTHSRDMIPMSPGGAGGMASNELQRAFRKCESMDNAAKDEDTGAEDNETALKVRKQKVEEVMGLVSQVETAYHQLLTTQKVVDQAKAAAKISLDNSKASLRASSDVVDEAGIGSVAIVRQVLTGAKDQVRVAEEALEGNDVDAFEHEVQKAAYAVQELDGIVKQEKKKREEEDMRQAGRGLLEEASRRLEELKQEAEVTGVKQTEPFVMAVQAVENEISSVTMLMSGDPVAFLAACKQVLGSVENVRAALKGEKLKKEKNDQQRQVELARLQPCLSTLKDIQAVITQSFELASEEALVTAVAAALQTVEALLNVLEKSDNVSALRGRVDAAILQTANAERVFTEVKQRHEIRARDIAAARNDMATLEKRLDALKASIASDGELLAHLTEEEVTDATNAVADIDRAIRRAGPNAGDVLRGVVSIAADKVDRVDQAIKTQRQRIQAADKARDDELARLDLADKRLMEIVSGIGNSALRDKQAVKDVLNATEAAVRTASERLHRPMTYAWLQHDELKQERAAVNDAIAKVELAEAAVLEEKRRYESLLRDQRANQANLDFAAAKLAELRQAVEDAKLQRVPVVQQAMDECETAYVNAVKSADAGVEDAEQGKRAIAILLDKLKKAEGIVASSKAQREAEEKEKAEIQDKLDLVFMKLQGVSAMIEAAGPAVMQLTEASMQDASGAVNNAAKLLRRGDNLKELGAAVRAAAAKVDVVEAEARTCKANVEQATRLRTAVSKKLASLIETLSLSQEKAESTGVQKARTVEAALRAADDALTGAKRKAEGDLDVWMREGTAISRMVDEASFKVEAAEEAVDDEAAKKEKAEREREDIKLGLDILIDRHEVVLHDSKEAGVAHLDVMVKAVEATEAEILAVRNALAADGASRSVLIHLPRLISAEEDVLVAERRKLDVRAAEVQKAASELPALQERLERLEALVESAGATLPAAADQAFRVAQKAVRDIERFVAEGVNSSVNQSVPRTDAALLLLQKAADQVQKHHSYLQALEAKRLDAKQRLQYMERRYSDLQDDVADFCSKSDHLRVQLDAEWGSNCWWGSQTSHTQTDGAPMGRGEMKPISCVAIISESVAAAEAAMLVVRKNVEAELPNWVEKGSATIYRSLDEALIKIERAADVLEQEKLRVSKEDQERRNAVKILDQHSDRLSKLKVTAEARNVQSEPAVVEALRAAESALETVAKLLEAGNAASSPAAMDVAVKKITEAEEVTFVELQRKDRYEAQRMAAKEELAKLQARALSVRELAELLQVASVAGVSDALKTVDKAIERAGIAINSEQAIAVINKEVRTVLQRIESAEREVRRERVRREEMAKLKQRQEDEARLRSLKEAEEQRRKAEQERTHRLQLEAELDKLNARLSVHRPTLMKLQSSMAQAEDAVKAARNKLTHGGGLVAAQAAAQSALDLANTFENSVHSVWAPERRHVGPVQDGSMASLAFDSASGPMGSYLDRTTHALEAMARNIDVLSQNMIRLNQSVAQQWDVIEVQNELLTSGGSSPNRAKTIARLKDVSKPRTVTVKAPEVEVRAPSPVNQQRKAQDLYGDVSDDEEDVHKINNNMEAPVKKGSSPKSLPKPSANVATSSDVAPSGDSDSRLTVLALLSKYYKANVFDRLKDLVTKGGVTLQDCIASGSLESGHLELFAGDYESYKVFAPLFDPVIRTCHPLYKETTQQPIDLNYKHLDGMVDLDPSGTYVKKARLVMSRNLCGFNLTPKMNVQQLREVEAKVCEALKQLTGRMAGTYTPMRTVMEDQALQEELEQAELPQTYRLTESSGMMSAWPEGRGVFLNADKSLCVFINIEDHITIISTEDNNGGADKAKEAFKTACKVLKALSKSLDFEFDDRLGNITPSPAKLGTAMAFSLMMDLPNDGVDNDVEQRYPVCIDRDSGSQSCILYNKLSLGVSEVDAISQVVACAHEILQV